MVILYVQMITATKTKMSVRKKQGRNCRVCKNSFKAQMEALYCIVLCYMLLSIVKLQKSYCLALAEVPGKKKKPMVT